jgi:hypothetical protein
MTGWWRRPDRDGRRRLRKPAGCLLWLIALLVLLIAAAILFGGFQQGVKASGLPHPVAPAATADVR